MRFPLSTRISTTIRRAHTDTITEGGNGGAIYGDLPASTRNSTFYNNRTDRYGGALHLAPSPSGPQPSSLVVASTFGANAGSATSGGTGGGEFHARPVGLQRSNDTFDSIASLAGGALYNRGAEVTISQGTLVKSVNNPPAAVGSLPGAYTNASATASTTFINSALIGTCNGVPPTAAIGNLEAGNGLTDSCNLSGSSMPNLAVQSLAFGAPVDNGRHTPTRMSEVTSVMLGAAQSGNCELTDPCGFVRGSLSLCDVGAVQTAAIDDSPFRQGFEAE